MKNLVQKLSVAFLSFMTIVIGTLSVVNVPSVHADPSFAISSISANCNGTGTVTYTGTIPNGGFTLTLYDQHLGAGGFVISDPVISTTITSGTNPVGYTLDLSGWTGGPHYRVDSNYNTKSESLYCAGVTPTVTPTPTTTVTPTVTTTPSVTVTPTVTTTPTITTTPTVTATPTATPSATPTVTVTPTPTTDPCANNACVTPTPTNTSSNNSSSSSDNSSSSNNSQPAQEVLAASTMASTGTFSTTLMNFMLIAGMMILAAGATSYAKEKNS